MIWPLDLVRLLARRESAIPPADYPDDPDPVAPEPAFEHTIEIPRDRAGVYRVYGNPGSGKVDPAWERRSLTVATKLAGRWNGGKGRLYCHRLAEPYVREALARAERAGVIGEITRLGCFNFRHQRHDPTRPLSYHSWGIALDLDPARNGGRTLASKLEPWSAGWRAEWPDGLTEPLVAAFEGIGWRWGGRWFGRDRFVDPMHFELVA
jgi:hypothetical protein